MKLTASFRLNHIRLLAVLACCFPAMPLFANPTGGNIVSGQGTIQSSGNTLTVTTSTSASILNWQSFSIAPNEITKFVQPSVTSSVLNRVLGNDPSALLGSLQSNGKVFLINPYGILVGAGAHIDVAGFVASTLNISDQDFLNGKLNFQSTLNAGKVDNQGTIRTPQGGSVYLIALEVENSGIIQTPGGQTILAAGQTVQLMDTATPGVTVEITGSNTTATNLGQIMADAGTIGMAGAMVRNSGTLDASSVVREGGRIFLKASTIDLPGTIKANGATQGGAVSAQGDVLFQTGNIEANGGSGGAIKLQANHIYQGGSLSAQGNTGQGGSISVVADSALIQIALASIDASGATQGGNINLTTPNGLTFLSGSSLSNGAQGGTIHVLGENIMLAAASLDASGTNQGGTVLVGGDYQGSNPNIQNAQTVTVNPYTQINVSATEQGNGGKAVVWSDQHTAFGGNILARGGVVSGDGGQVEVSGKELLTFGGTVDAGASNGHAGSLLLDPKNIIIDAAAGGGPAYIQLADPHPGTATSGFGSGQVIEVANGNLAITSPDDNFVTTAAGAVFLFNGSNGSLINTLYGSTANDKVGNGGITALGNGNFVVSSWLWHNGAVASAGAVTWIHGSDGKLVDGTFGGMVSSANSLVGSTAFDFVGRGGVTALSNSNYVVDSYGWNLNAVTTQVGAVTWANGSIGIAGAVSSGNSLVGSTGGFSGDRVGIDGITPLLNGNYVVRSRTWNLDVTHTQVGAVTWVDGSTGKAFGESTVGAAVSPSNSLVGSMSNDEVGSGGVTELSNGNYVVDSTYWNGSGAVTWANSNGSTVGPVSILNSLYGGGGGITPLLNGNYVVSNPGYNLVASRGGAVTWVNGSNGFTIGASSPGAAISISNSLYGTTANDNVGMGGVKALSNGNYVVDSYTWNGGTGAVTWGNGSAGTTGMVSASNSLVGSMSNDQVGFGLVTALNNGNYVVDSYRWNGNIGAVTWGNGSNGSTIGTISAGNSLVGSTSGDQVGYGNINAIGGVTALSNGNYVVDSNRWNSLAGAVTWGNGTSGTMGMVNAGNSLVGDNAGVGGVMALSNGNYVVDNYNWNGQIGAVTWGNGSTTGPRLVGAISIGNSLVGGAVGDQVGYGGVTALNNGNYVVGSYRWNFNTGAVTWGDGSTGTVGMVNASNSLVGSAANDQIGIGGIAALSSGNFVVASPNFFNSTYSTVTGRVDIGSGTGGAAADPATGQTFGFNTGMTASITPASITAILNTGSALVLQANNDITLNTAIIANNLSGNGGALTLQAGRSILLNAGITTDNGALTLSANDSNANSGDRLGGNADISIASGAIINTGTGAFTANIGNLSTAGAFTNAGMLSIGAGSTINTAFNNSGTFTLNGGSFALVGGGSNSGIFNINGTSQIQLANGRPAFINLFGGTVNINSTNGFSFFSNPVTQNGILNNAGIINVNNSTSWEAAFTNTSTGHLNITAGKYLSMQNGQAIAGSVDIGTGGTLWVSERHGTNAAFNGTTITGTGTLQVLGGATGSTADLTSVSAAGTTLRVGTNGTVNFLDSNSLFANLNISGGTLAGSSFTVNHALNYTGGTINSGLLLASGSNSTLTSVTVAGSGAITNQGTLNLANSILSGSLNNQGALNVSGAGTNRVTGTLTQSGVIDVASGSTLQKLGGFTNAGSLKGFGTINVGTGTLTNNGTVAPGASPGALNITGNYTQGPTGTLAIELGGLTPGTGYDVLNVTGATTLDGILNVSLYGGFLPSVGNGFTVINASSVSGTFATVNLPTGYGFLPNYGSNFFGLDLASISLPPVTSSSGSFSLSDSIFSQPLLALQSSGGPFYGVTVITDPSISGTTQSPVVLAGIQDLFIPADSPFAAGLFGTSNAGSGDAGGGFGFGDEAASGSQLLIANNIPFPLFYAQVTDEENNQPEGKSIRRPFGMCSAGGGQ